MTPVAYIQPAAAGARVRRLSAIFAVCGAYLLFCAIFDGFSAGAIYYLAYLLLYVFLPAVVIYAWRTRGRESDWLLFVLCVVGAHAAEILSILVFSYFGQRTAFLVAYPLAWIGAFGWLLKQHVPLPRFGGAHSPILLSGYALALAVAAGPMTYDISTGEHHVVWLLAYTNAVADRIPPGDPFFAGNDLLYHYFINLHAVAASVFTGEDYARLLQINIAAFEYVLMVLAIIAAVTAISRNRVLGLVVVAQFLLFFGYEWVAYVNMQTANAQILYRLPSLILAVSLFCLIAVALCDYVRQGRGLPMLVLALAGASGARANVLPMVVCGLAFAIVLMGLCRERFARGEIARVAIALGFAATAFVVSYAAFYAGSGIGAEIMKFAPFNLSPTLTNYKPAPLFEYILDQVGVKSIALLVFIAAVAIFKQFALIWFVPYAFSRSYERVRIEVFFLLGVWISGAAVLLLFENNTNEQWAFYMFAHVALSLLLANVAARWLESDGAWRRMLALPAGMACLLLLAQAGVYTFRVVEALPRLSFFRHRIVISHDDKMIEFTTNAAPLMTPGVVAGFVGKEDMRLFPARIPGVALYASHAMAGTAARHGTFAEVERRISFLSKAQSCESIAPEAEMLRRFGAFYLFYTHTDGIPDASCTRRLLRIGDYRLYEFIDARAQVIEEQMAASVERYLDQLDTDEAADRRADTVGLPLGVNLQQAVEE